MRAKRPASPVALVAVAALALACCDDFDIFKLLDGSDGGHPLSLRIGVDAVTLLADGSYGFWTRGGVPPYRYVVTEGSGRIDASSGLYVAPSRPGTETVRVTDSRGANDEAVVTVVERIRFTVFPASAEVGAGSTITFGAFGGVPPYLFSVASGAGTIDGSTGLYTAPAEAGTDTVRVVDSSSSAVEATVTVVDGLAFTISPRAMVLYVNTSVDFDAVGGVEPCSFALVSGAGSVEGTTGVYIAPSEPTVDVVRVTDAVGSRSEATVTVHARFTISPASVSLTVGTSFTFNAFGGQGPYAFGLVDGTGSVDGSSGVYVAPATPGSAVIEASDALGNTARAAVVVDLPSPLVISPSTVTMNVDATAVFSAAGGQPPYSFSVAGGLDGSIDQATGVYLAPAAPDSGVVRVTDSAGARSDAAVTVVASGPLAIYPDAVTVSQTESVLFSASGGTTPYVYSVVTGEGTVIAATGAYAASEALGTEVVRVTDAVGGFAEAQVGVAPLAPASLIADGSAGSKTVIRLTWIDRATGEEGTAIERKAKHSDTDFVQVATVGPNVNTYDDDGLRSNRVYSYRVRTFANGIYSAYSNVSSAIPNQ